MVKIEVFGIAALLILALFSARSGLANVICRESNSYVQSHSTLLISGISQKLGEEWQANSQNTRRKGPKRRTLPS